MQKLLIAGALFLLASAALAQAGPPNPDTDHDGKVTLAEFKAMQVRGLVRRMDTDRDGKITRAEADSVARQPPPEGPGGPGDGPGRDRMWQHLDTNSDGVITTSEIETSAQARFAAADANKDGWLNAQELLATRPPRPGGRN